jgi:serine/threonine protein kinase
LGKLTSLSDISNELKTAKALLQYPGAEKYCVLPEPETLCKPAPMDKQEASVQECEVIQKRGDKTMYQFEIEYGGKTLKTRLDTEINSRFPFFDFMRQMLEIGAFLTLHGCIHNDLHSNNLVLDDKLHPRVIDFGRTFLVSNINMDMVEELTAYFSPEIGAMPPESSLRDGIIEGVPLDSIYVSLYEKKPGLNMVERILGVSRKQQIDEFREFISNSKAFQSRNWVETYKLYWPTVDSWAIGTILIGILRRLLVSKEFSERADWLKKQGLVKEILREMLRSSPRIRIDCVEALALYDPTNDLVSGQSGKAWLEKKRH